MSRQRSIASVVFVLAAATLILSGCGYSSGFKASVNQQQTVEHIADTALLVDGRNGKVEITADPVLTQVEVEATLVCGGATQQDADTRIKSADFSVERTMDRMLVIKPRFPEPTNPSDGAKFIIRVPSARNVTVKSSNGSIKATGLAGDLAINTSNGSVRIMDHDGPATIETSNGSVNVSNLNGSLRARSANGSVDAMNISGSVDAITSNGSIDVKLAADQVGPLTLKTSNGGVKATVGAAFRSTITVDSSNGRIKVIDPSGRVTAQELDGSDGTVTIGEGGSASKIDTSNGPIEISIEG